MKCHLCKEKIEKPYWIVDMKFCESCHKAINVGSIPLLKKSINRPIDIDMNCVILNGNPYPETLKEYTDKGWNILLVTNAKNYHPYTAETDTIMFVAKPIDKDEYDRYMDVWNKEINELEGNSK